MATRMQQRRGTAAQWAAANPVLTDGEVGYEKDTGVVKVGNGTSNWNQLSPILGSSYLPLLGKAADADRLDGLDSTSFAKTTETSPTSATRLLSNNWGPVTAFPALSAGVRPGDTCLRTDIGTNGSFWTYSGNGSQGSVGWVVDDTIVCTSTTRPAATLYKGLRIYETDTASTWVSAGTVWLPMSPMACYGKLWRSMGFSGNMAANQQYAMILDQHRLAGGFTAQHDTSANAWNNFFGNALIVPLDGFYRIDFRGYATSGPTPYDVVQWVGRNRAGVADVTVISNPYYKETGNDRAPMASDVVPLKAGDKLACQSQTYVTGPNYYGRDEVAGAALIVTYQAPLLGAAPF